MSFHIRPFIPADYEGVAAVYEAATPEMAVSPASLRFSDESRDQKYVYVPYVAEAKGRVIGLGAFYHDADEYHPRRFWLRLRVLPEWQGRGVGKALYDRLCEEMAGYDPISLTAPAREDRARAVRFLADRGFEEQARVWESVLNPQAFDPAPYAGGAVPRGVELVSLRELETDPNREGRLYHMSMALLADTPAIDTFVPQPFEQWRARQFDSPDALPDGIFVAVKEGRYIGTSELWGKSQPGHLYVGLTGVLKEHRRQGIAMALKLRAIAWAKANGYTELTTMNESGNAPMIAINNRLGFQRLPALVVYKKSTALTGH